MDLQNLYFLRESKDLTQNDIAKLFNVTREAVSQWENNKFSISLEKLNMYSNYFETSIDYIVKISKKNNYNSLRKDLDAHLIGKRLKEIRKKFHISQMALAKELHTTQSTISAYESGKVMILTCFAYQICKNYSISMDWLCGKID